MSDVCPMCKKPPMINPDGVHTCSGAPASTGDVCPGRCNEETEGRECICPVMLNSNFSKPPHHFGTGSPCHHIPAPASEGLTVEQRLDYLATLCHQQAATALSLAEQNERLQKCAHGQHAGDQVAGGEFICTVCGFVLVSSEDTLRPLTRQEEIILEQSNTIAEMREREERHRKALEDLLDAAQPIPFESGAAHTYGVPLWRLKNLRQALEAK